MNYQVRTNDISKNGLDSDDVHNLERMSVERLCRRLVVFNPPLSQIDQLVALAQDDLPMMTDSEIIKRVAAHNPDSFWAIQKKSLYIDGNTPPQGFMAFLLLNTEGVSALLSGEMDRSNPSLDLLAGQHERPAGFYIWALHAKGTLVPAVSLIREKLRSPYSGVEIYARAASESGARFIESIGCKKGVWWNGKFIPDFYHYHLATPASDNHETDYAHDLRPPYDNFMRGYKGRQISPTRIGITAVHSIEELMKVISIRSAVYMGEQQCPFDEEYDGNDFAASHLLGYVGNEPAGCIRIRYFAGFAKLERLAVRKEFRHMGVASDLVRASIELCRLKGYRKLYAHSQKRLVDFWKQFNFYTPKDAKEFSFSDFDYIELMLDVDVHSQAITTETDPYLIIRPEGCWDRPGILESSNSRPVTRPSIDA